MIEKFTVKGGRRYSWDMRINEVLTVGQMKKFLESRTPVSDDNVIDVYVCDSNGGGIAADIEVGQEMGTNLELRVILPEGYHLSTNKSGG